MSFGSSSSLPVCGLYLQNISGEGNLASEGLLYISALTAVLSSSVMSTWGPVCILSTLVCVLIDGDTVVAVVEVVAIEVVDVVVNSDVVELLEIVD